MNSGSPHVSRLPVLLAAVLMSTAAVGESDNLPTFEYVELQLQSEYDVVRRYAGRVESRRRTVLSFQIAGSLAKITVDAGDTVARNTRIASLDRRLLWANLQRAEADVAAAEAQAHLALKTLKRMRELSAEGHSSAQAIDRTASNAQVARARLLQARAVHEQARINHEYGLLRAPFGGVVQQRFLDEGAVVAPGVPVVELVEVGSLEVRVGLPMSVATDMRVGQTVHVRVGERRLLGHLRGISPAVDDTSRTMTAIVALQQPTPVTPGALAELELTRKVRANGYWLPITALTKARRGLWAVLACIEHSTRAGVYTVERRLVETIYTEGTRAFVQGTLQPGERVISSGVQLVVPGQLVQLIPDEKDVNGHF